MDSIRQRFLKNQKIFGHSISNKFSCQFLTLQNTTCLKKVAKQNLRYRYVKTPIQRFPNGPYFIVSCLDPPHLSQCLNNIQLTKYDNTLRVKCYAPGNPDPAVTCQLWDENDVVLRSLGNYFYALHISCHKALLLKSKPHLVVLSVLSQ